MDADAWGRVLTKLLPRGAVWALEAGTNTYRLLRGIADEFARVDVRAFRLLEEGDPRTAVETLDEWERVYALPDQDVLEIPATVSARQQAVTQKVRRRGGQSLPYFIALAATCGYVVTIDDSYGRRVLRAGFRAGDRCFSSGWAHVWRFDVQPPTGSALTHAELERIIRRAAPGHTVGIFNYL